MTIHYAYWNEYFGYKFTISDEDASTLPKWSKQEKFPPLSPRVAIENSKIAIQRILQEIEPFEPKFSSCALTIGGHDDGEWWYYLVSWYVPDLADTASDWSEFSIPVLFDGSTPDPIKFKFEDRFDIYRSSN